MDLFTHIVFAYLLSFIIWGPGQPQYIAAGALAGGLPDADALLAPLARRFPILRHHGITHSFLGVTIIAAVGCLLLPYLPYFPHASTLLYFVAMEIGGLAHIFLDGFTHFAVTPLLPISWRQLRLDADVAINFVMLCLTAVTLVMLSVERGAVPFNVWVETAWILTAVYGGYLCLRWIARWRAQIIRRREGYSAVLPSTNPLVWTLAEKEDLSDRYRIRYRPLRLGGHKSYPERSMEVAKVPPSTGPVDSPQEALERSYPVAMKKNRWLAMRYHFGEAVLHGDTFDVLWYMVEAAPFGRTIGVRVQVDRNTGEMKTRSAFPRISGRQA
jgi:membrane-bound metal-dependent hydrolase YbcI (DUF457 family)